MKYENSLRSKRTIGIIEGFCLILLAAILIGMVVTQIGCTTTIIPRTVSSSQASWDGTNANSGFIGFEGANGVITPYARTRYNGLIDMYGKKFVPPIGRDYGLQGMTNSTNFLISPQALAYFARMNAWRKSAIPPVGP